MKLKYELDIQLLDYAYSPSFHSEPKRCSSPDCNEVVDRNSAKIEHVEDLRYPNPCPVPVAPMIMIHMGFIFINDRTRDAFEKCNIETIDFSTGFLGYSRLLISTQFHLAKRAYRNYRPCGNGHVIKPLLARRYLDLIVCERDCELAICSSFFANGSSATVFCSDRVAKHLFETANVRSFTWLPSEDSGLTRPDLPSPYFPNMWK